MRSQAFFLALVSFLLMAASCGNEEGKQKRMPTREELIEANRQKVSTEAKIINDFVKKSGWEMNTTKTGIRYDIYHSSEGDSARMGMLATITFQAYLLDGSQVGSSEISGPVTFKLGQGDQVSGLHEALTLLQEGDSARFIIPSYLAYGLTGNQNDIPPNAALLYDLALVDLD